MYTHEPVMELDRGKQARFLGIWLGNRKPIKDTKDRIKGEINTITTALRKKKVTDKHILYILNRVLIPRIEFRMQHCHLNWNVCNYLTIAYRKLLKNKAMISGTMPNSVIHHKKFYGLKSIWQIQTESQITNLVHRLNDPGPAGLSTIIRLKQGQIKNWEPTNILEDGIPPNFDCKGNFTATILRNANELGLEIRNWKWAKIFS